MSAKNKYDIIVVGAGCAGSAAAKKAAELGMKVLCIEKSLEPGAKNLSGTCLNVAALMDEELHYVLKCPIEREIHSMRTYHITEDRMTVINEIPKEGVLLLSIRRDVFDKWHAEQAEKAGAEMLLGRSVVDIIVENDYVCGVKLDNGDEYRAKVVIDAGGVNSIVGRKAGLISKRSGTKMILYTTVAVELGEEVINERFRDEQGGVCIEYYLAPNTQYKTWPWIFPKKDCVTVGTGGYMTPELVGNGVKSVNDYMQNFLNLPVVKKKLEGGKIVSWGAHLEFDSPLEKHVKNGLILAGEAGGFVVPFLGEGMPEAMITGIYAAKTAAQAIKENDVSESNLEKYYEEYIEDNMFFQGFMYVGQQNKDAILKMDDEEISNMMQSVVLGGGFISNVVHQKWMKGADEGDMDLVQEAKEFLDFIQPYRAVSTDFQEIYKKIREEAKE